MGLFKFFVRTWWIVLSWTKKMNCLVEAIAGIAELGAIWKVEMTDLQ